MSDDMLRPVRTVVVDDERLARRRIQSMLSRHRGVEVVAACGDGGTALEAIELHDPELLFLDIAMPESDGLQVVQRLGSAAPHTVFVTAHEEHAVAAFELAAVDYILKPYPADRLVRSVDRAIDLIRSRKSDQRLATLQHLLEARDGRADPGHRPGRSGSRWSEDAVSRSSPSWT